MTVEPSILIIGAADTGRAPIAGTFLRRLLMVRELDWPVSSAGVVGHDGDPPQPEAREAMVVFNLDIAHHCARSLNDELVTMARALIAIDSGIARVVRMRYPIYAERLTTLGDLARRQRDIPDPFRMQVGAWINYAREIETLLVDGIERLIGLVQGADECHRKGEPSSTQRIEAPSSILHNPLSSDRNSIVERCERLLTVLIDTPTVIDWTQARHRLEADIKLVGLAVFNPSDMVQIYVAMLLGLLSASDVLPSQRQIILLRTVIHPLHQPIDQQVMTDLAVALTSWSAQ